MRAYAAYIHIPAASAHEIQSNYLKKLFAQPIENIVARELIQLPDCYCPSTYSYEYNGTQ